MPLFLDTSEVILRKKSNIVGEILFSSSENAILSILLKYREIDVQIQTFTDEIETTYIIAFLNGNNCRFEDYKYYKTGHCAFILVQRWAILCQWPKRFMFFDIECKH